jgi:hypothetical protein
LTLYDLCHAGGLDFDDLFAGDQYAEARAFVAHPDIGDGRDLDFGSVDALHLGVEEAIQPPLPEAPEHRVAAAVAFDIATPKLPPSPTEVEEAEHQHRALRTDLYRLMNTYTQLRRHAEPGFQLAAAVSEATEAFGSIDDDTSSEVLGEAIDWVNERAAAIALENPDLVRKLARARRRHATVSA